jgi:hypothetical protein
MNWSIRCLACGGLGRVVADVLGEATVECDDFYRCDPELVAAVVDHVLEYEGVDLSKPIDAFEIDYLTGLAVDLARNLDAQSCRVHYWFGERWAEKAPVPIKAERRKRRAA